MNAAAIDTRNKVLRDQAGLCVACGLCLPGCPTYRVTRDESESPRGRLSLMRALASGELAPSGKLVAHLDHCLACRACERACPSNVPYGRLFDNARERLLSGQVRGGLYGHALFALLLKPKPRRWLGKLLSLYQRSGLRWLVRTTGILRRSRLAELEAGIGDVGPQTAWRPLYAAAEKRRGDVAVFTGCVTDLVERQTITGAIHILNRLGYDVHIPTDQDCCGALHRQQGKSDEARSLMECNLRAFSDKRFMAVLSCASGCSVRLREYGDGAPTTVAFRDITAFLANAEWPEGLIPQPLLKRIAVHDACLQRNVLREEQSTYRLLGRIPGAEITPLPENSLCCGAGGGYFLDHPDMARALRAPKLAHLKALAPDMLVTTNTGCAMHLRGGLHESGLDIEVLHPVALLARQLGLEGDKQTGIR
jgi:glycolate oxidase iron-sulfur subunit